MVVYSDLPHQMKYIDLAESFKALLDNGVCVGQAVAAFIKV